MKILRHVSARIALIMVILILPLNVIAMIYMHNAQQTILDQEVFNTQKLADYQMQQLENQMDNARTLLTIFLTQDADLLKLKNSAVSGYEYESAKLKFYYRLRNMAETANAADGYYYYFPGRKDGVVYGNSDGEGRLVQSIWAMCADYGRDRYPTGWHIHEWDGQRYLVFLSDETELIYGVVIRLEKFLDTMEQSSAYPGTWISLEEQPGNGAGGTGRESQTAEEREPKERGTLLVRSERKNLRLTIGLSRAEILRNVAFPQRLLAITSVSYLLLIPALYAVLQRLLIGPLRRLNEAHRQIGQGNADYRIRELPATEEFRELAVSFNRMVDNLERLRIESYEKELSRQKMELQNLQLQIRPHFLLNTFNLIFTLSQKRENAAIQRTVIWLSEYFRYIFREERELELFPKELKMIVGYVAMASVRYSGRVQAEYALDPELDFVRVPPLLIHNFVENAVKYGVKKDEILHIRLEGHYRDKTVSFFICDDGKGMTEEILAKNRSMLSGERKPESQTEHLGLYNSLRRLNYFYGEEAQIEVFSRLGEGTRFEVRFPYAL